MTLLSKSARRRVNGWLPARSLAQLDRVEDVKVGQPGRAAGRNGRALRSGASSSVGLSMSTYSPSRSRTMTAQPLGAASSMSTWTVFDLPEPTVPKMPTLRGSTSLFLLRRPTRRSSRPERVPSTMSPSRPSISQTPAAGSSKTGGAGAGRSLVSCVRPSISSPWISISARMALVLTGLAAAPAGAGKRGPLTTSSRKEVGAWRRRRRCARSGAAGRGPRGRRAARSTACSLVAFGRSQLQAGRGVLLAGD